MAGRSSILVMVLALGVLFSLLYISDNTGKNARDVTHPLRTTTVDIEYGAAIQSTGKGYFPKEARVTLGIDNRVVWTNSDSLTESVVSDTGYVDKLTGKKFDSGFMLPNSTFEFVFTEPREYSYHAEPHPWMQGRVIVTKPFP